MTSIRRRAPILMLTLALATTALLTPPLRTAAAAASETRRPNLQMVRLHEWHIQNVNGRRLLRFTTIFVNEGPGAFELRGARSSRRDKTMEIDQVLYRTDGSRFRREHRRGRQVRRRRPRSLARAGRGHLRGLGADQPAGRPPRRQDRLLLLRHHPLEAVASSRAPIGLLRAGVVRHASLHDESGRRVGGLGRSLPVGLRLPVDRHHRPPRRHVPRARHGRHPGLLPRDGRTRQLRVDRDPHPGTRQGQHGASSPQRRAAAGRRRAPRSPPSPQAPPSCPAT